MAIIGWWAYDLISGDAGDGEKWYEFGRETLVMTLTQVGINHFSVVTVKTAKDQNS